MGSGCLDRLEPGPGLGNDLDVVLLRDQRTSGERRFGIKADTDTTDSWEQGYSTRLTLDIQKIKL